jgi:hypothetical protein
MPTYDPFGFDLEIPPTETLQNIEDKVDNFQKDFNNLDQTLEDAIIPSNPPKSPSGLKTPGKIFDPIYGPDVIFGYVLTSDFMSFCDYKPISRVGDLVFVVGKVGKTVVAEIGVITSGCMDVRNNAIGSGAPYLGGPATGGLKGGCNGQKSSTLYKAEINADFLNPGILNRIDPCIASGDLANCLPSIMQDIMGLCDNSEGNFGNGSVDDFNLGNQLQKLGSDHINKLNSMLKKGLCGNPELTLKFDSSGTDQCLTNDDKNKLFPNDRNNPLPGLPYGMPTGNPNGKNLDAPCVTSHLNYISNELDKNSGLTFNDNIGDFISKHDLEIVTLTSDIKNYYQHEFATQVRNMLNIFPGEFPRNSAEAINLAMQIANDITNGQANKELTISSYKNIVEQMKSLQNKLNDIAEKPLDAVVDLIRNDPELNRFWGELLNERDDSLSSLKPPPPDSQAICPTGPDLFDANGNILEGCADLATLQKEVRDGVGSVLELINGKPGKNGLIATNMINLGVQDVKKATGAAGMNPIDSLDMYRKVTIDKVSRCMKQTAKIKAYLQYCEKESYSLMAQWGIFSATFISSPRDSGSGSLLSTGGLSSILHAIKTQCLTLPQRQIEQFALETEDMMSDIRDFNFISMDPVLVASNPSLAAMIANPSILIPSSNIGMIIASAQSAIQQCLSNAQLISSQLSSIFPTKESLLNEMMAYARNIVQMAKDSLMSLQGCLPPLPCIAFDKLFDFDFAFNFKIGFPFKLNIPVLDFAFPDIDFKFPIVFPTIIAPTGFKFAIGVKLPKIRFPRIPRPPRFPPDFIIPTIRLPNLTFPLDLSRLNRLLPKFPNVAFNLPLPQIKFPRFKGIVIPPIKIKLPKFNLRFGGFPFPKLNIKLPKFPIKVGFHIPISFDIKVPIPSIELKLPQLPKFPLLNIPGITINIPKINIPFSGGLAFGSLNLPKISIPFPAFTIPSLCGDAGKTVEELIADGKNIYNRILNMGISGGRPMAVANCSLWTSPHFHGWIVPVPCSAMATDFSKCVCMA